MSKQLTTNYNAYVLMLTEIIVKQKYIYTTANIWSENNKSYTGMYANYLSVANIYFANL